MNGSFLFFLENHKQMSDLPGLLWLFMKRLSTVERSDGLFVKETFLKGTVPNPVVE